MQVVKDSQLFTLVAFIMAVDAISLILWISIDPFKPEIVHFQPRVSNILIRFYSCLCCLHYISEQCL